MSADYFSTPAELAVARAALDHRAETFRRMQAADPLVSRLLAWLARADARRVRYAQDHPRPLPIDGHAYAARRRRRTR